MFLLISVCSREIFTECFETYNDAHKTMIDEVREAARVDLDEIDFDEAEYDDGDVGIGEWCAYVNDGINHDDFDWMIVDVPA